MSDYLTWSKVSMGYQNSYTIELDEKEQRILYIPTMPCATTLDSAYYEKIYKCLNLGIYPLLTILKQTNHLIVPLRDRDFSQQRAFAFPYIIGPYYT